MSNHWRNQETDPPKHVYSILKFLIILKLRIQNKSRKSPDMSSEKISMISMSLSDQFNWNECCSSTRYSTVQPGTANADKAKSSTSYSDQWSETCSMKILSMYIIIVNGMLSMNMLMMCTNSLKNLRLMFCNAIIINDISSEDIIVTVNVLDFCKS